MNKAILPVHCQVQIVQALCVIPLLWCHNFVNPYRNAGWLEVARFCTQCGAASGSHTAGTSNIVESSSGQKVQSKIYEVSSEDTENLIDKTENWLNSENQFEVQRIKNLTTTVLQIRKKGNWRRLVGMSTALSIKFEKTNESLQVEIGQGHWLGKVATGATSWFILWPLAVSTAYGVYEQYKAPKKIFEFIEQNISRLSN